MIFVTYVFLIKKYNGDRRNLPKQMVSVVENNVYRTGIQSCWMVHGGAPEGSRALENSGSL